ncbi:hypothetical protein Hanom_Chr16g01418531 [Helianthus anomalus]
MSYPLNPSQFGSTSTHPPLPTRVSTVLTDAVVCLLFTCPNHLNLPSFILSDILATLNLHSKPHFLSDLTLCAHTATLPPQHPHLCSLHPVRMCLLHGPTLCPNNYFHLITLKCYVLISSAINAPKTRHISYALPQRTELRVICKFPHHRSLHS